MHEESDGVNENDNSEVVILPDGSHVDESLLTDSQLREERNNYERKLDEKLRDLGLYEDDMTINQKEELLAVVVISCETAEAEENKRQLIREYLEGAQSLEDEIEFTFQESAWLANEANLLCSSTETKQNDVTSDTKASSSFGISESSTSRKHDNAETIAHEEKSEIEMTTDLFDDDLAYADPSLDPQPSSSSSEAHTSKQVLDKEVIKSQNKSKVSCDGPKETEDLLTRQIIVQRQKLMLDKSISSWKPCTSPTDKSLPRFSPSKKKAEKKKLSVDEKFNKYLAAFDRIASYKPRRPPSLKPVQLSKPYILLHHGSIAKRACKLDNYDYIIGVNEKTQTKEESGDNIFNYNTLTRAKSAFHRVKPNVHGTLLSFPDNSSHETPSTSSQPGAMLHSKKLSKPEPNKPDSPEVIFEDSYQELDQTDIGFARGRLINKQAYVHQAGNDDSEKKLPQFSDLRPEICKNSSVVAPSPINKSETSIKYNCIPSSSKSSQNIQRDDILVNSIKDYSSDSSSPLIDVETIVDEDIEEFIMKRKAGPSNYKPNCLDISNESKRLRKTGS